MNNHTISAAANVATIGTSATLANLGLSTIPPMIWIAMRPMKIDRRRLGYIGSPESLLPAPSRRSGLTGPLSIRERRRRTACPRHDPAFVVESPPPRAQNVKAYPSSVEESYSRESRSGVESVGTVGEMKWSEFVSKDISAH